MIMNHTNAVRTMLALYSVHVHAPLVNSNLVGCRRTSDVFRVGTA
jgi:hypothetical protein